MLHFCNYSRLLPLPVLVLMLVLWLAGADAGAAGAAGAGAAGGGGGGNGCSGQILAPKVLRLERAATGPSQPRSRAPSSVLE